MIKKIRLISTAAIAMILTAPAMVFAADSTSTSTAGTFTPPSVGLPKGTLIGIITAIMNWLLVAIGILGIIGFCIAGVLYLTAAGNDDQIKTAKKAMTWSIVGVLVALAGSVAIQFAQNILGASSTF